MNQRQAIAAMREIHSGIYKSDTKWTCVKRLKAPKKAEREAARARLAAIREANGGEYPRPVSQEVRDLQTIVFASETWTIGYIAGVGGIKFLHVSGQGETLEEAVQDARDKREADRKRYAEIREAQRGK
jgi:hypothetical protein